MNISVIDLPVWFIIVLAIFANYRLAQLLSYDTLTEPIRKKLGKWAAGKKSFTLPWLLSEWFSCAYCNGIWISFFFTLLFFRYVDLISFILYWLAIAGAQAFLESRSER